MILVLSGLRCSGLRLGNRGGDSGYGWFLNGLCFVTDTWLGVF